MGTAMLKVFLKTTGVGTKITISDPDKVARARARAI
jgi:hypothetical protein